MDMTAQLPLFDAVSLNATYEIKRQIRLALSNSVFSRDQVVDRMNELGSHEGFSRTTTKAVLDTWTKDSEPGRLPTITALTILCRVLGTVAPFEAALRPLGCAVLDPNDRQVLQWAKAELEKKKATKRARVALEAIE